MVYLKKIYSLKKIGGFKVAKNSKNSLVVDKTSNRVHKIFGLRKAPG